MIYSEKGHTPWKIPPDTPYSILIKLDTPISCGGATRYYMWYTHMSFLEYYVKLTSEYATQFGKTPVPQFHIAVGAYLGKTGLGNKSPHLHFGVVTNQDQLRGQVCGCD